MAEASTNLQDRIGISAVQLIFAKEFGWFFREQTVSDFGIDAEVETATDENRPSGKLLALQIKCGPSFFRKGPKGYTFNGEMDHLDYWLGHSLPVFLILHNPENGLTLWQRIERHLVKVNKKGWSIVVPEKNVLDKRAKTYLASGISRDAESVKRYRFAADKADMKRYNGNSVFFEFQVWVNKSLSIRGIRVFYDDYGKNEPDELIDIWAAYHSVHEVMAHFYPWLTYHYADFEDYLQGSGEVETHTFEVELNDAAKTFLQLEAFYETEAPVHEPPIPTGDCDDSGMPYDRDDADDRFDEEGFRRAVARDRS